MKWLLVVTLMCGADCTGPDHDMQWLDTFDDEAMCTSLAETKIWALYQKRREQNQPNMPILYACEPFTVGTLGK